MIEPSLIRNRILMSLIGKEIVTVRRQLFLPDLQRGISEELADGPIEFTFDNASIVHFEDWDTFATLVVKEGKMKTYGESYELRDCSDSLFWKKRRYTPIKNIEVLQHSGAYPTTIEPALKFVLDNGEIFFVEYVSNGDVQDTIRLSEQPSVNDYEILDIQYG